MLLALARATFGALANVGQVFQSKKRVWVLRDDLFGDAVIGLPFQPSLSLLDALQAEFRATSAFFLQAFA